MSLLKNIQRFNKELEYSAWGDKNIFIELYELAKVILIDMKSRSR